MEECVSDIILVSYIETFFLSFDTYDRLQYVKWWRVNLVLVHMCVHNTLRPVEGCFHWEG